MSKKKTKKPVEKIRLSGRNIYTDKKGRTIFYDLVTKKGYLVDKASENSAVFYKNRLVIILFAAILFGATFLTKIQALIAWAVMMALAEFAFRKVFLKKLEPVTDVDFERLIAMEQLEKIVVSGIRADDMAMRFKYAGMPEEKIEIIRDYGQLVEALTAQDKPVYIMPTYTAMLELRGTISKNYGFKAFWE